MQRSALDLAILITAGWRLSTASTMIPIKSNALDLALKKIADHPVLERWRGQLQFHRGPMGTRCYLLNDALDQGVSACMLALDGSSFTNYRILISDFGARALLNNIDIGIDAAIRFGKDLSAAYDTQEARLYA